MMRSLRQRVTTIGLCALLLAGVSAEAFAQLAFIQIGPDKERGQAWLFTRPDGCYAVTPEHVVKGAPGADLLFMTQATRKFVHGVVLMRWDDVDLALLKVDSGDVDQCGAFLVLPQDTSDVINVLTTGELRHIDDHGGLAVTKGELFQIERSFMAVRAPVMQTFSGSVFFVDGIPVGMLMDAATKVAGVGRLLRMDEITRRVVSFLTAERVAPSSTVTRPTCDSGSQRVAPNEVSARENGGRVVSWSAMPERFDTGAENLITASKCANVWRTVKPAFPVSITLDLAGAEPVRVSEVTLDGSGVNRGELPNEYEILVRTGGRGGWRTIGSGAFSNRDRVSQSVPNVLASEVMIKLYSGWSAEYLALRRVTVLSGDSR